MPGRAQARISRLLRDGAGRSLGEPLWLVVPVTLVSVERDGVGTHIWSGISDLLAGIAELLMGLWLWPAAIGAGFAHRGRIYVGLGETHDVWEIPRAFEAEVVETFQSRGLFVHHQGQS